jgi:hypothetical protein
MSLTQLQTDLGEDEPAFYDVRVHFQAARRNVLTSELVFLLFGRGRANDLLIEDRNLEVSKVHAALTCDSNYCVSIMDVGSLNGTFVNERRLLPYAPRALVDGDTVRFGRALAEQHGAVVSTSIFLWSAKTPPLARARVRPRRSDATTRESALEQLACFMCTEPIVNARVLACGHMSCHACFAAWLTPTRRTCPVCRAEQPAGVQPSPCLAVDSLLETLMSAGGSVTERAAYERRVAHAKIAEAVRAQCARIARE